MILIHDGYMIDPYSNNTAAGHRRWILYPQTQTMGTGDVPQSGDFLPANSTWVFDSKYGTARPAVRDSFVAWPTKGYVPYTVIPARWSFGYPNANFSNASVSVTKNGVAVSAVKEVIKGHEQSYALTVVNKEALVAVKVKELFPRLRKATGGARSAGDYGARHAGRAAGRSAKLATGAIQ